MNKRYNESKCMDNSNPRVESKTQLTAHPWKLRGGYLLLNRNKAGIWLLCLKQCRIKPIN